MSKMNMRKAYGEALLELGRENNKIVALEADLGKSTMSNMFGGEFPERYFQMGIAEANMISAAAGLALTGHIAYASTFAVFASGRPYDQIRSSVAIPRLNVKICGSSAGLSDFGDGKTHQSVDDITLMRVLPNMKVFSPADYYETKKMVRAMAEIDGPCYIRLGRAAVPVFYDESSDLKIGKGNQLRPGTDVTVIATGIMVASAMEAASELAEEGIDVRVIDMHTIKPIDEEIIVRAAQETGKIVTAEEHSVIGGLGGAVAEVTARLCPCRIEMVGQHDTFGESGKPAELRDKYGMTAKDIVAAVREIY